MADQMTYYELMMLIEQNPRRFVKYYGTYTLEFGNIAAAASANANIRIDSGSMFIWTKGVYFTDIAGAAQTQATRVIPLVNVQMTDSGAERQIFDVPNPVPSLFGTAELPAHLPVPYLFMQNAQVSALATNFSAATPYDDLRLTLIGYRIRDLGLNP